MSCFGNTIVRALALVTLGTGAAFVDWGFRPLTLELTAPEGSGQPATADGQRDTPDQDPGVGATDNGDIGASGTEDVTPTVEPAPFDPFALGTEIGTDDAYELWLTGEVAFIDARPQKDYVAGHIPYSYLVPAESIDHGRLGDMMEIAFVDPSWRVVVYCEGGSCDASHLVALTLQDMGFTMIHIDIDGFPAWEAAGYEVETGPDTMLGDVP
jgi:rhodanese-related sulfurtransferase